MLGPVARMKREARNAGSVPGLRRSAPPSGLHQSTRPIDGRRLMKDLLPQAEKIAALLTSRRETIAIAESSTGGLVSAALLAIPGASAYFLGGAVVYTRQART